MIILLSPAKSLDESALQLRKKSTIPFKKDSAIVAAEMKKLTPEELQSLMGISQKLSFQNFARYQRFAPDNYTFKNSKQALFLFKGAAYVSLDAKSLSENELDFAQTHLRMLSGLYGLLKPFDLIQPYRLEMGTKHPVGDAKNLYDFWGDKITGRINQDLLEDSASKENLIINLASNEYFKAVKRDQLKGELLNIHFKEFRGGNYKVVAFNAKKARGLMTRYIVQNRITQKDKLKAFGEMDYRFNATLSTERDWVFAAPKPSA